ncbi:hypothetical protein NLJ89_g5029 [Agrocybe chaxingu]|uniref:Uncharacterized protein n=1 Tax=Agrocybe chaxingu TaxID=84603 RepID=A0A9W8K0Z0_9AGAR|nr:hypothetical protein NLJ89_g5029 [Agrocybe chaxingu]
MKMTPEDPADVEDAAADTAAVTRAIHARQDEEDDTVDPTTANDSADADEDDTAEDEDAAAEPTETPDSLATAQDLTTQVPDEESLDARAVAPTIGKRQVAQSPSGNTNVIASDLQGKVAVPGSSGSSDTFPGSIDVSLPGSRRSIMKQLGRRAPQQGAAAAGAIAGAVGLGNSGSN